MREPGNDVVSHCARWIVPVDRPAVERGCVVVQGERILAVGAAEQVATGRRVEYGDAVITPGFVNAHAHLEFSGLSAPLGERGMAFPDWIMNVLEYRRAPEFDARGATFAGLKESLRTGTTTLGDIASCLPSLLLEEPPADLDVTSFIELIGLSEARAAAQAERLAEHLAKHSDDARVRRGISPHAPYTIRPALLEAAVPASAGARVPLAFHLAESREELQLLATGDGPMVDYMRTLGAWDPTAIALGTRPLDYLRTLTKVHRALVIHGNYLADDEIDYLAAHAERLTTVYCPRTHDYFNHPPHPLPKLLERGASVALGTDGRCTNPDLSLLEEMRHTARQFPMLSPERILQLGTLDGAQALGLAAEVGSLTPGKRADFVVFQEGACESEPCAALLQGPATIGRVYHRGRNVADFQT
ncbi:MAG: hypothetical protein C0483_13910 [Pirellula sp.]|nr:hypothetical protein [Pirellula sp.]